MLENIEDDVQAGHLKDQGPHRKAREARAVLSNIPSPKFAGCCCCGDQDHSRQKCRKIQAIKDANNGKVPNDYEGAYETSMKKASKVAIKAVTYRPAETTQRGQDLTSAKNIRP